MKRGQVWDRPDFGFAREAAFATFALQYQDLEGLYVQNSFSLVQ